MSGEFPPEVKEQMYNVYSGYCAHKDCGNLATEFHHILSNTKVNRNMYPLFLPSPFNCFPICHGCHMTKPLPRILERLVIVYELWLTSLLTSLAGPH